MRLISVHVLGDESSGRFVEVEEDECPACAYASEHLSLAPGQHALLVIEGRVFKTMSLPYFGIGFYCRPAYDEELTAAAYAIASAKH